MPPSGRRDAVDDDEPARRRSTRECVQTSRGADYTESLRASRAEEVPSARFRQRYSHAREVQDGEQPSTSGSMNSRRTRRCDADQVDFDSDAEVDSDDDIAEMMARAQAAMSVISRVATKIRHSKSNDRASGSGAKKSSSSGAGAEKSHSRVVNKSSKNSRSKSAPPKNRTPLFPDLEDGEIVDEDSVDNDSHVSRGKSSTIGASSVGKKKSRDGTNLQGKSVSRSDVSKGGNKSGTKTRARFVVTDEDDDDEEEDEVNDEEDEEEDEDDETDDGEGDDECSMRDLMMGLNDVRQTGLDLVGNQAVQPGKQKSKIKFKVDSARSRKLKKQFLSGLEVGEAVSPEMKLRIWKNEYVDFVVLLYPDDRGRMDVSYNGGRSMTLTERRPRELRDILEWTEAFEIDASVYLERPENRGKYRKMMTYARYIRKLASRGLNWREYDHQYRHDRPNYDEVPEWTGVRQDLIIDCLAEKLNDRQNRGRSFNSDRNRSQYSDRSQFSDRPGDRFQDRDRQQQDSLFDRQIPKSFCFTYHSRDEFCDRGQSCAYKHECPWCDRGIHPAFLCHTEQARIRRLRDRQSGGRRKRQYNRSRDSRSPSPQRKYTRKSTNPDSGK